MSSSSCLATYLMAHPGTQKSCAAAQCTHSSHCRHQVSAAGPAGPTHAAAGLCRGLAWWHSMIMGIAQGHMGRRLRPTDQRAPALASQQGCSRKPQLPPRAQLAAFAKPHGRRCALLEQALGFLSSLGTVLLSNHWPPCSPCGCIGAAMLLQQSCTATIHALHVLHLQTGAAYTRLCCLL